MSRIVVGSLTQIKISAVQKIFSSNISIVGVAAPSGVHEQPVGEQETERGAMNRALFALDSHPDADIYFGIENGLVSTLDKTSSTSQYKWVDAACVICLYRNKDFDQKNGINGLKDDPIYRNICKIKMWSETVDVPPEWIDCSLPDQSQSYVFHVKSKLATYSQMDSHDPHFILTNGEKTRQMILSCTIDKIKTILKPILGNV